MIKNSWMNNEWKWRGEGGNSPKGQESQSGPLTPGVVERWCSSIYLVCKVCKVWYVSLVAHIVYTTCMLHNVHTYVHTHVHMCLTRGDTLHLYCIWTLTFHKNRLHANWVHPQCVCIKWPFLVINSAGFWFDWQGCNQYAANGAITAMSMQHDIPSCGHQLGCLWIPLTRPWKVVCHQELPVCKHITLSYIEQWTRFTWGRDP